MRASRWLMAGLFVASMAVVVSAQQPGGRQFGGKGGLTTQVATNVALQEELKVTEDQKAKLKVVADKQAERLKKVGEAFKSAGGDKDKLKELFTDLQKDGEKIQEEITKTV